MVNFSILYISFLQSSDHFKIEDIMCYFTSDEDCYMLEISLWFQNITKTKNFSLLMSGK